ncbi:hypothetical protein P4T70_31980 [Bacillus mobilis]|uniref:hypothetical protein n=1 Tax=Bacillus mobilis TaxID=2026190 RepID=UPI002E1D6241|nr:hypothetical protein [Bacillus mobilis]
MGPKPRGLVFKSGSACTIPNANRWLQQPLFRFIGLAWAMHTPKILIQSLQKPFHEISSSFHGRVFVKGGDFIVMHNVMAHHNKILPGH